MVEFLCTPDDGSGLIVAAPPVEIRCVAEPPDGTWDRLYFTWGDGTETDGEAPSHTYEEPGQYTVAVVVEGFVPADGATPASDLYTPKHGYVNVCGAPEPEFTYVYEGGLDFRLVNHSQPVPHCLDLQTWEIFEGTTRSGEPWATFEYWEPSFTLPHDGTWTVLLTQSGIGGTEAAMLRIDAKFGVTDAYYTAPHASDCATVAGPPTAALALPLALLYARRRRAC